MSSLPRENLEDVLRPLDRWTLDTVQFTNRRFLWLIEDYMSRVCLRDIDSATFEAPCKEHKGRWRIRTNGRPERAELSGGHWDSAGYLSAFAQELRQVLCGVQPKREELSDCAGLFLAFFKALRSSHVAHLRLGGIDFTPALATLVLEMPIIADQLDVYAGSCAELTAAQFQALLLHFSPRYLFVGEDPATSPLLRAAQLTDEFVRALSKKCKHAELPESEPVGGGSFSVTDDAIVDFFMQPDNPAEPDCDVEDEKSAFLSVSHGSFTKDLFKRLVQASAECTRTQPAKIYVEPVRVEIEDLRDFAQNLRGGPPGKRIYEFAGKQHGKVAPMDLQITLEESQLGPGDKLVVTRAPRPRTSDWFE